MANLLPPANNGAPGTHALIIGVSKYPFASGPLATPMGASFGIEDLSCAAKSAASIARWLLTEYSNPGAPLASLRVLLSPSEGETIDPRIEALLDGQESAATRAAVRAELFAFRQDCLGNEDSVAFVYIAGHGVQMTNRGATVLLQDFAEDGNLGPLDASIDVVGCQAGMEAPGIARKQLWFSDACRQIPDVAYLFETMQGGITLDTMAGGHVDAAPLFLSASTRENAWAVPGESTVFSRALLQALGGAAAVGPDALCSQWHVGSTQLIEFLPQLVRDLALSHGELQSVDVRGLPLGVVAQRFAEPPQVEIRLNLLPEDFAPPPAAELLRDGRTPVGPLSGWPVSLTVSAGLYQLNVDADPPLAPGRERWLLNVKPPSHVETIEVSS